MSWGIAIIGRPEAVKRRLAEYAVTLVGQSKEEFEAVKPALDTLLDQNVANGAVLLEASGHASFAAPTSTVDAAGTPVVVPGLKVFGNCQVSLKVIGQFAE